MKKDIAYGRLLLILAGIVVAVAVFWGLTPDMESSSQARETLVRTFSILGGIVIAIITLLGDSSRIYAGSWRVASAHRRELRRALVRNAMLFYAYIIVVGGVFAAELLNGLEGYTYASQWIWRIVASIGAAAFVWSLGLPLIIIRIHQDQIDEEVDRRKRPINNGDGDNLSSPKAAPEGQQVERSSPAAPLSH